MNWPAGVIPVETVKNACFGAMIKESDKAVEEHTRDYGVEFIPKGPFNFHGLLPLVLTRVLANDEAAYGTFGDRASAEGDTALADRGIPPDGPNGDLRHMPRAGEAVDEAK